MRQRWGAFSVKDHIRAQSFTAEILLYDRLIVPTPPEGDAAAEEDWRSRGWNPERLRNVLEILGPDLTIKVPWNDQSREIFKKHYRAVPGADAYYGTSVLIAEQIIPIPDPDLDVTAVRMVAAYPSLSQFSRRYPLVVRDANQSSNARRSELGVILAHEFLAPTGDFTEREGLTLLTKAAELARDEEFRESRRLMYQWQEDVLDQGFSVDAAKTEMQEYLTTYNGKIKDAMVKVRRDHVFAVLGAVAAGAGLVGSSAAALAAPPLGVPLLAGVAGSATGSLLAFARLVTLERKPSFPAGEAAPSAMFHTARRHLGFSD